MIERLYSHKVVNKSDHNDDPQARKEDEEFLDHFTPREDSRASLLDPRASLLDPRASLI